MLIMALPKGDTMSQPNLSVVEGADKETSKEQYVINYLKSMLALEEAMGPYKEHR